MSPQPQQAINNQRPNRTPRLIALTVALVVGLSTLVIASAYLFGWRRTGPAVSPTSVAQVSPVATRLGTPVSTPIAMTTLATGTPPTTPIASPSAAAGDVTLTPNATVSAGAEATLRLLDNADVPKRDLYAIAARLKLKSADPIPTTRSRRWTGWWGISSGRR